MSNKFGKSNRDRKKDKKDRDEKDKKEWDPHPVFGSFTPEQWGQMQYKHLDHHLRQFNV